MAWTATKKEARPGNAPGRLLIGEELVPWLEVGVRSWPYAEGRATPSRCHPHIHFKDAPTGGTCASFLEMFQPAGCLCVQYFVEELRFN
jgi:hypothetical protein